MMEIYFSREKNGFFEAEIHKGNMPEDVVAVSHEEYERLLSGQAEGKQILADGSGFPILVEPPGLSVEMLGDRVRQERDIRLKEVYDPVMNQLDRRVRLAEAAGNFEDVAEYNLQRMAWYTWAESLCSLPEAEGFPWAEGDIPWPEEPM